MSAYSFYKHNDNTAWSELHNIRRDLATLGELDDALQRTRAFLATFSRFPGTAQLDEIENDYVLMRDFMLKGYQDDRRPQLYHGLVCRLFRLLCDVELAYRRVNDATMASRRQTDSQIDLDETRSRLEAFVSDVAMLSLELEGSRAEKQRGVYAEHQQYVQGLFEDIVFSPQWSHDFARQVADMVLSPTVDTADAQVMVSAVMLSAMNIVDPEKLLALLQIYREAADVKVRQRALVGWVFALDEETPELFGQIHQQIDELLDRPEVRQELQELQMQVVYCQNAERDNARLQQDIMPSLLRNQNLEITRFGIREKMDDPLEDILHPDADDRKMEELEKSVRKMNDMRKQGADIYFGGFSQMKRFPFFYTLCNWFMPFYLEHPQLAHLPAALLSSGMMKQLFQAGPFCDSDKYSFALGFSNVFNNLPGNIRDMLLNGEATMEIAGGDDIDHNEPSLIRRMYLQDLYRFFRLSDRRKTFVDPFDSSHDYLFIDGEAYQEKMGHEARNVQKFLLKQERYGSLKVLHDVYFSPSNIDDLMMKATLAMHDGRYLEAQVTYAHVCELEPDNVKARKGYALASFYAEDYHDAAEQYQSLADLYPANRSYALNLAIALINDEQAEEGVKTLFKLAYEYPDDLNIKRAMAWGQLWLKNTAQAEKLYEEILAAPHKAPADYLNAGYSKWFVGDIVEAVALMKNYLDAASSEQEGDRRFQLFNKLTEDRELLDQYHIPKVDRKLMVDLVTQLYR